MQSLMSKTKTNPTPIFSKTGVVLFDNKRWFLSREVKNVLTKEINSTIITLKVKIVEERC